MTCYADLPLEASCEWEKCYYQIVIKRFYHLVISNKALISLKE